MHSPISDYDFRIYSDDKTSHITFSLKEYIHKRLSSLSCTIEISDNKFNGWNINVWFTLDELLSFIRKLETLDRTRRGKVSLNAMTSEDFNITFVNYNNKGDIVIYYSLTNIRFNSDINLRNTLSGGFKIDSEFFFTILSNFKQLASIAELEVDIDYT